MHAKLMGSVATDGKINLTKQYDGVGGEITRSSWTGDVRTNGTSISGSWKIPGNWGGTFRLSRQTTPPPASIRILGGRYQFPAGQSLSDLPFVLLLTGQSSHSMTGWTRVSGWAKEPSSKVGGEPFLHASVVGVYHAGTGELRLVKKYDRTGGSDHEVYVSCVATSTGNYSGQWLIPGSWGAVATLEELSSASIPEWLDGKPSRR
ncbi:MAG: hypothetical protein R3B90_15005 [Planctomycetaceae bacterium]